MDMHISQNSMAISSFPWLQKSATYEHQLPLGQTDNL